MREKLSTLPATTRKAASCKIVEKITALPSWQTAQSVLLFSPLATEPDIAGLCDLALAAGKTVFYPRVRESALEICQVQRRTELRTGSFGILEPPPAANVRTSPSAIDMALIPGLAFDAACHRLGRGKGYYDRLLAGSKTLTVGVCFACQRVTELPIAPHDIRLQLVVTEDELITR
jgi:5-formyltetrahydrofolate cyclo-ligase